MHYWHLSKEPLSPSAGHLSARSGEGHYSFLRLRFHRGHRNMTVEDFVEKYRPAEKPSRKGSWFMCAEVSELYHASPGPADSEVYLVELEPEAPSRHHFGWIALVNDVAASKKRVSNKDAKLLKEVIQNYWRGEPCPESLMRNENYGWEYLARRVVVQNCMGPTFKGLIR